jgi:hypothetical protein
VTAPEASLEALVRDELRGPVTDLVRRVVVELVHEQLNGALAESVVGGSENAQNATNGAAAASDTPRPSTDRKTCRVCGRQDVSFDRGRRVCRNCRVQQQRERKARAAQATDDDP